MGSSASIAMSPITDDDGRRGNGHQRRQFFGPACRVGGGRQGAYAAGSNAAGGGGKLSPPTSSSSSSNRVGPFSKKAAIEKNGREQGRVDLYTSSRSISVYPRSPLDLKDTLSDESLSVEASDALLTEHSLAMIRQNSRSISLQAADKTLYVQLYDLFFQELRGKPAILVDFFGMNLKERSKCFAALLESVPEALLSAEQRRCSSKSGRLLRPKHIQSGFAKLMKRRYAKKIQADDLLCVQEALLRALEAVVFAIEKDRAQCAAILEAWSRGLCLSMGEVRSLSCSKCPKQTTSMFHSFHRDD